MGSKEGIKIIYAYFINDASLFVRNISIIAHINEHTHTHTHIYIYIDKGMRSQIDVKKM